MMFYLHRVPYACAREVELGREGGSDLSRMDPQNLGTENRELRDLCGYLSEAYAQSKKECYEWKSLGRFTAKVLTDEIARYQSMDKAIKGQIERLVKENRELQDMCMVLDQTQVGGGGAARQDKGLTPPDVSAAVVYADVVSGMGVAFPPHYIGRVQTKGNENRDSQAIERGAFSEYSKETALVKMKKKLEKVEAEKVELIKSLSAAHLLAADSFSGKEGPPAADHSLDPSMPTDLKQQWEKVKNLKAKHPLPEIESADNWQRSCASPDIIMNAITLLDIVRRLEAATARGFADPREEAEALVLQQLVNIAWQKIQEKMTREKPMRLED